MKKMIIPVIAIMLLADSCKKKSETSNNNDLPYPLGWQGKDDPNTVPQSITNNTIHHDGVLPASVDLTSKFPPVGDQGRYGTCVAWATAYNIKTTIDGIEQGLNTAQLAIPANQFSPKDLFTAVSDSRKGNDCNGTDFTVAMDVLLNRGVATLQTVPYANLGNCSRASLQSNWTAEASLHRIKNYRRISLEKNEIKSYLANNQPVLFGARLGDNFMQWNSDNVISSSTTFDQVGPDAYHALTLAGYNDLKGPNGAFLAINSWGTRWGNAGRIWIDYNFFVNAFCFNQNVFIATNDNGNPNPPGPTPVSQGSADLVAWAYADQSYVTGSDLTKRLICFNVFNTGSQMVPASSGWAVYYLYYNAFDASDYGILIADIADNGVNYHSQQTRNDGVHFNENIPGGGNLGTQIFGADTLFQTYIVPGDKTGYYYLCLWADPLDAVQENDESNNYFYTTSQYPVTFKNGVVAKRDQEVKPISEFRLNNTLMANEINLAGRQYRTAVNQENLNAYSPEEISWMIKLEKQSGRWQHKLNSFLAEHPNSSPSMLKTIMNRETNK